MTEPATTAQKSLEWAEFVCWTMVILTPFLWWVNGAAVSNDQVVARISVTILAFVGGLALRVRSWMIGRRGVSSLLTAISYEPTPGEIQQSRLQRGAGRILEQLAAHSEACLCLCALLIIAIAVLTLGGPRPWEDVLLLELLTITTGTGKRSAALLLGTALFWASFPTLQLPTYWVCLVPMVWLWRCSAPGPIWWWEAFALGFVTAWLGAPFLRTSVPSYGWVAQVVVCSLFGLQMLGLAGALRITRRMPAAFAAILAGLLATGCEFFQAVYGFGWPCMALSLPAAPTLLAQWAYYIGPFGVSFCLYVLNFLWLPDLGRAGLLRWVPPATASILAGLLCLGGYQIVERLDVRPLTFAVLIVQPQFDRDQRGPRWNILDRLTEEALARGPAADLLVWPARCLRPSVWTERLGAPLTTGGDKDSSRSPSDLAAVGGDIDLAGFYRKVMRRFLTPCLVGNDVVTIAGEPYKSACLINPDGTVSRHDKIKLTPIESVQPGKDFHLLHFKTRDGREIRLAVSICYEMYFPWLPQYQQKNKADAVVHLTNEEWCHDDPSYWQFETWACQYRAIETRSWQLVCATLGNSAVIDPGGVIRGSLQGKAGVIRVPSLFEDASAESAR
jgi:apolipoprotein N-acyltransferase